MIEINGRIAKIIRRYNNNVWRLKFTDNQEIVNVFYANEHDNLKPFLK
jgi:hypothetical protein